MNYYKTGDNYFMSEDEHDLITVSKEEFILADKFYFLKDFGQDARFLFDIGISDLKNYTEDINILFKNNEPKVSVINTSYSNWLFHLDRAIEGKWRVNIVALGDVGRTLLTGLKLLGSDSISEIGIYDLNKDQLKRLEMEFNQVLDPFSEIAMPHVKIIEEEELFDCDMLTFCASKAIPEVGSKVKDVRMVQYEANKGIVTHYAKLARDNFFKGVFAVVSDPVDLLSKVVFEESNKDSEGIFDFGGLKPEQVIGYGLGVMNARANYYANRKGFNNYLEVGRAFGPHGADLVIINDLDNYDAEISKELTELAVKANKEVRAVGFKPYIAPALSSAAISIINTIKGKDNYSSIFIGGTYYGCKNRLQGRKIIIDKLTFDQQIFDLIDTSYQQVKALYE